MITIIAAVGRNDVIGRDGALPWSLPGDLRRFRRLTTGHSVIMGRATYESIGHPLSGRMNIVLTHNPEFEVDGVEAAHSVEEAVRLANRLDSEIFVIGGAAVYAQFLDIADRMELTIVDDGPEGDTYFPRWDPAEWEVVSEETHEGTPSYRFTTLERSGQGDP